MDKYEVFNKKHYSVMFKGTKEQCFNYICKVATSDSLEFFELRKVNA